MKVILIGFMGSGKSTMGKRIAKLLNVPFIDSDKEIECRTEKSIPELFELVGEAGFRELEKELIQKLAQKQDFVLATGGGMPCFNDNIDKLNELGETVYLKHSSNELTKRLINAKKTVRPLIQGKTSEELLEFITSTLETREVYYQQAKFITHKATNKPLEVLQLIGIMPTHLQEPLDDSK